MMRRLLEKAVDTGYVLAGIVVLFPARDWLPLLYGYVFEDDWT